MRCGSGSTAPRRTRCPARFATRWASCRPRSPWPASELGSERIRRSSTSSRRSRWPPSSRETRTPQSSRCTCKTTTRAARAMVTDAFGTASCGSSPCSSSCPAPGGPRGPASSGTSIQSFRRRPRVRPHPGSRQVCRTRIGRAPRSWRLPRFTTSSVSCPAAACPYRKSASNSSESEERCSRRPSSAGRRTGSRCCSPIVKRTWPRSGRPAGRHSRRAATTLPRRLSTCWRVSYSADGE